MLKLTIAAVVMVASSPVLAQAQPAASPQAQQPPAMGGIVFEDSAPAKPAGKLVCRDVGEVGSRLVSHRVCMTKDQWAQQERDAKDDMQEIQRRSTIPGQH
jgi:hypothetical protein